VAPDLPTFWSGTGSTSGDSSSESIVRADALPAGIVFSTTGSPLQPGRDEQTHNEPSKVGASDYKSVAVFLPDGTAREDCKLLICSRNGSPLWVMLRSLTGEVSVSRYQTEGGQ